MTRLKEKINEALSSVLPITLIVLLLSATITPMPLGTILLFLAGAVLLIIGMGLFSLGADMAMQPVGEGIGKRSYRFKNRSIGSSSLFSSGHLSRSRNPISPCWPIRCRPYRT